MFRILKKIITYVLLAYVALYSIVWLFSPTVIRYFLSDYLSQHQLVLSDVSSIRYNPFISHLEITDVSISKSNELETVVFSLDVLELELHFYELLFDQVYVSAFVIDGLYVKVKKSAAGSDEGIEVAGISLPQNQAEQEPNSAPAPDDSSGAGEASFPYQLDAPEVTLKNSVIELAVDESTHRVKLNSFVISDLAATLAKQSLLLAVDSEVNQSSLTLDVKADLNQDDGKIRVDLDLTKIDLAHFKHFLPESITAFEGVVSYSGQHEISIEPSAIAVDWPKLSLKAENVLFTQDERTVKLAKHRLDSDALKVSVNLGNDGTGDDNSGDGLSGKSDTGDQSATVVAEGSAQISLDDFKTFYKSEENMLSAFKNLALNDVEFLIKEENSNVDVGQIQLTDAFLSDNVKDDVPALAQFKALTINKVKLTEQGIAIDDISLAGLALDAELNKDKVLLNLVELGIPVEDTQPVTEGTAVETETVASEEPQEAAQHKASEFAISLGEFRLADNADIHFTDNSVNPVYERHIAVTSLNAGPFDNQSPDNEIPYKAVGKSDKYAHFEFSGIVKPFAEVPVYSLKGFFKEISLPGISSYIKDALQYEIQSGQLDLGLDVTLTGTVIDGDADVLLRGIELTAADDHEAGTMQDHTSVPFNVALGMLKDSDGNVELSLPLSGDTSNPSFGFSGFMTLLVQQATIAAAQDYLITTFVPYASVVKVAIVAGEFALKVRVNDLVYPPGKVELQPEHEVFLKEFAALMKDKEDVQVRLCAVATAEDIGKPAGTVITEAADIQQLKVISNQRAHNFKDYMVEKEGVGSSRLLNCTPQINSSIEAKPSLTFET
ncbi:DUF748 domain-containing protein [Alkalimarinus coralli]|uniref:DUF748 domain-containing protein n=1 Tax=Alkalimarinus coralli TaxID=2935863 RepID=UPI00202B0546|nr:DUF748 domain-containing protein [Alkalimarinus coralli]